MQRSATLIVLVGLLLYGRGGSAQDDPVSAAFAAVPFQQWLAGGSRAELPWHPRITPPKLTLHQRMAVEIEVQLDGNELVKRCCDGQAVALVEITDPRGRTYRNVTTKDLKDAHPALHEYMVSMSWQIFMLPGDYQAVIALYYSGRDAHSLSVQKIHVEPLKRDPLPESWRDLPPIEFCDPQPEGLDEFLLPNVEGRLHLAAKSGQQVRVEVLENLTPYPSERRRPSLYNDRLGVDLPILKTFVQMEIANGSVDAALLDFTRRSVIFGQPDIQAGKISWAVLKEALSQNSATTVNVHDLQQEEHFGEFFREEMTHRLAEAASDKIMRIFIVVSGPMDLGPQTLEIVPPADAKFAVFYLKCTFLQTPPFTHPGGFSVVPMEPSEQAIERSGPDGIGRVLKGLQPKTFPVDSAQGVRQALASILSEISRM